MNSSTGISKLFFSVCCIILVCVLGTPESRTSQNIRVEALRAHTAFLAHNLLEGRGTASRGEALAAQYLVSQLREYGLKPAPGSSSGFRIPVPLTATTSTP